MVNHNHRNITPWLIWFVASLFFASQFILRLYPGLIMNETMVVYGLDVQQYGHYASMYYIGYAGMQIPAAWFLVRFSPRYVLCLSAALCGLSAFASHVVFNWQVLYLSRFLIGVGSAFAFLGVSELITQWFPKDKYARMVGITFTFGLFGAVYGGRPTAYLIGVTDWHFVLNLIALIHIIIALLIFFFVKSPHQENMVQVKDYIGGLGRLLQNRSMILLSLANLLMVGALEGFADIWGVTFLMKAFSVDRAAAATFTSMIFIGMIFGGPILALISHRVGSNLLVTMSCGVLLSIIFFFLLNYYHLFESATIITTMFVVGVLCCYQVLVFAIGIGLIKDPTMTGMTTAFLNCVNMCGGVLYHNLIGWELSVLQKSELDIVSQYTLQDFVFSLQCIPIGALIGAGIILIMMYLQHRKEAQ